MSAGAGLNGSEEILPIMRGISVFCKMILAEDSASNDRCTGFLGASQYPDDFLGSASFAFVEASIVTAPRCAE
jgi:hypothetical protein